VPTTLSAAHELKAGVTEACREPAANTMLALLGRTGKRRATEFEHVDGYQHTWAPPSSNQSSGHRVRSCRHAWRRATSRPPPCPGECHTHRSSAAAPPR